MDKMWFHSNDLEWNITQFLKGMNATVRINLENITGSEKGRHAHKKSHVVWLHLIH